MNAPRVLIAHPDGRRYSVTEAAFADLYGPAGFAIEGPETKAAFTVDAPRERTRGFSRPAVARAEDRPDGNEVALAEDADAEDAPDADADAEDAAPVTLPDPGEDA